MVLSSHMPFALGLDLVVVMVVMAQWTRTHNLGILAAVVDDIIASVKVGGPVGGPSAVRGRRSGSREAEDRRRRERERGLLWLEPNPLQSGKPTILCSQASEPCILDPTVSPRKAGTKLVLQACS